MRNPIFSYHKCCPEHLGSVYPQNIRDLFEILAERKRRKSNICTKPFSIQSLSLLRGSCPGPGKGKHMTMNGRRPSRKDFCVISLFLPIHSKGLIHCSCSISISKFAASFGGCTMCFVLTVFCLRYPYFNEIFILQSDYISIDLLFFCKFNCVYFCTFYT